MDIKTFKKYGHDLVEWIGNYYETLNEKRVTPNTQPNDVLNQLPAQAPNRGESMEHILKDLDHIIMPHITHWQHPRFFGYFPSNTSFPGMLAEYIVTALNMQCMNWNTSPAANELEIMMLKWIQQLIHLPNTFQGSIHYGASISTFTAMLMAREHAIAHNNDLSQLRVYASKEAHTSIKKAAWMAGINPKNYIQIPTNDDMSMDIVALETQIKNDVALQLKPTCMIATMGSTSSTACDPITPLTTIAAKYNIWLHIDAAYLGTALILPEIRKKFPNIHKTDSMVFNPHKWLITPFPCSLLYTRHTDFMEDIMNFDASYLQYKTKDTKKTQPVDLRNRSITLGRRFYALKLWFILRYYGVENLKKLIRQHILWAKQLYEQINQDKNFETLAHADYAMVCFRYCPPHIPKDKLNALNEKLLETINQQGNLFITHTYLNGIYTLRFCTSQANATFEKDILYAWKCIQTIANDII